MDSQRLFLFFALALVLMLIWQSWEMHNAPPIKAPTESTQSAPAPEAPPGVPSAPAPRPTEATPAPKATEALARGTRIAVRTDVIDAVIDAQGGDMRVLKLRQYPVTLDKPQEAFPLLHDDGLELFIAQSGLIGLEGQYPNHKTSYSAESGQYALADGQNELRVPLKWRDPGGMQYTKTYVFRRGSYVVDVEFAVKNETRREWAGYLYGQFQRMHSASTGFLRVIPSYTGGAIYTTENHYEKISFDDMAKSPLKRPVKGGWVAMLQHYFVGSWLPAPDQRNEFYTDVLEGTRYVLGLKNQTPTKVAPGESGTLRLSLY
ncbi:MAG: membrane protein insertase YidC, partial [Gammaproteobacteria bacterium]|nr:membrane protein insertase YidC [Gammaproteobacteria bacterium]